MLAEQLSTLRKLKARTIGSQASVDADILDTEDVIVLSVQLPKLSPAQRRSAARFAVEEHLLAPVDQDQVVVGVEMTPGSGRWLVAVLPPPVVVEVFKSKRPVLSKLMLVQIPQTGWFAAFEGQTVLLRKHDGSGAVLPRDVFDVWAQAIGDRVEIVTLLPTSEVNSRTLPLGAFDLRRNRSEDVAYNIERGLIWSAAPVLMALLIIWGVQLLEQRSLVQERQAALTELSQQLEAQGRAPGDPIASAAAALAQAAATSDNNSALQTLLSSMAAVSFQDLNVAVRTLRFSSATGVLVLSVSAPSLENLQSLGAFFVGSGVQAMIGSTEIRDGMAVAELSLMPNGEP